MLLGILSSHKKSEDSSTSVYRFEAALRAVEAEFVAQAVRPILSGIKETTKLAETGKPVAEDRTVQIGRVF